MKRALASIRFVGPCLLIAGIVQYMVYRVPPVAYRESYSWFLMTVWATGALALAWFEQRLFFAYFGSVALSVSGISYSMFGYGGLEMGGWLHALAAGFWVMPFHLVFRRVQRKAEETQS